MPNSQQSIADIKRAPASQKQVLVLKEKESSKQREEQKKKIEKKILSRLSNLLAKVKDIKQRHFHHHGESESESGGQQDQEGIAFFFRLGLDFYSLIKSLKASKINEFKSF